MRRFFALTSAQQRLFLRAWVLLLAVHLGLRFSSLAKVHDWLGRGLKPAPAPAEPSRMAWETWRIVESAGRHHLVKMSCLRRSLALQRLLAERGLRVGVFIGVRKEHDRLLAHAWIEVEGEAVGEEGGGEVTQFVPVLQLKTPG